MLPAAALDEGTLTAILDGGTVKVHQCDEQLKCLNPTQFTKTITIAPSAAFKWQVQTMLLSITDKIRNKQPLTAQEQSFLGMVSLPVHKMMAVQVAYNKQGADAAIAQYAEVIALDMTYGWVTQVVNELQRGASNLQNVDADKLSDWNRSVAEARTSLLTKQGQVQVRATAMQAFVANVQVMESVVGSRLANRVGASIAFASNMKQ
jgi:conjugative transfer pilus assembly protein TraH